MNTLVFFSIIGRFNNGNINFNLGKNWCFLFNNQWYYSRAFIKAYHLELGEYKGFNLHQPIFTF